MRELRPNRGREPNRWLLLCIVLASLFLGINSYSHFFPAAPHLYEPRNWLRLVTGMGTGVAMGRSSFPPWGKRCGGNRKDGRRSLLSGNSAGCSRSRPWPPCWCLATNPYYCTYWPL